MPLRYVPCWLRVHPATPGEFERTVLKFYCWDDDKVTWDLDPFVIAWFGRGQADTSVKTFLKHKFPAVETFAATFKIDLLQQVWKNFASCKVTGEEPRLHTRPTHTASTFSILTCFAYLVAHRRGAENRARCNAFFYAWLLELLPAQYVDTPMLVARVLEQQALCNEARPNAVCRDLERVVSALRSEGNHVQPLMTALQAAAGAFIHCKACAQAAFEILAFISARVDLHAPKHPYVERNALKHAVSRPNAKRRRIDHDYHAAVAKATAGKRRIGGVGAITTIDELTARQQQRDDMRTQCQRQAAAWRAFADLRGNFCTAEDAARFGSAAQDWLVATLQHNRAGLCVFLPPQELSLM